MANEVAVKKQDNVTAFLAKLEDGVGAALPTHCVKEAFMRAVQTSLRKNPRLMQCTPASLASAVTDSAQFGLTIGLTGHLVPYGKDATLVIDYKGVLDMAYRHERVVAVDTDVVCEGDVFEYERGADPKLRHVPNLRERGKAYAVYAIAWLKDSDKPIIDVMAFDEIEKIRKSSKAGKSGPWVDHWGEMAKKTVLKRICKRVPKSIELQSVLHYEQIQDQRLHEVSATVVAGEDRRAALAQKARAKSTAEVEVPVVQTVTVKEAQAAYKALSAGYDASPEIVDEVLGGIGMPSLLDIDINTAFEGDMAADLVTAAEHYSEKIGDN